MSKNPKELLILTKKTFMSSGWLQEFQWNFQKKFDLLKVTKNQGESSWPPPSLSRVKVTHLMCYVFSKTLTLSRFKSLYQHIFGFLKAYVHFSEDEKRNILRYMLQSEFFHYAHAYLLNYLYNNYSFLRI